MYRKVKLQVYLLHNHDSLLIPNVFMDHWMLSGLFYEVQQIHYKGKLQITQQLWALIIKILHEVFEIKTLFLNNSVGLLPQMIKVIKDVTLQSVIIYILFSKPQHFYLWLRDLICFQQK